MMMFIEKEWIPTVNILISVLGALISGAIVAVAAYFVKDLELRKQLEREHEALRRSKLENLYGDLIEFEAIILQGIPTARAAHVNLLGGRSDNILNAFVEQRDRITRSLSKTARGVALYLPQHRQICPILVSTVGEFVMQLEAPLDDEWAADQTKVLAISGSLLELLRSEIEALPSWGSKKKVQIGKA